jgi:hypothetical protein
MRHSPLLFRIEAWRTAPAVRSAIKCLFHFDDYLFVILSMICAMHSRFPYPVRSCASTGKDEANPENPQPSSRIVSIDCLDCLPTHRHCCVDRQRPSCAARESPLSPT